MIRTIFDTIEPTFQKFQGPNKEFEFRLGRISQKGFNTDIGKDTFEKVLKSFQKYTEWDKTAKTTDTMYYAPDNVRLCVNEETDQSTKMQKKNLYKKDFTFSEAMLDIRYAVANEMPLPSEDDSVEYETIRQRQRWSFYRKNVLIDMTIVTGEPEDRDAEEDTTYQIEIELLSVTRDKDTMYNSVHKVGDILTLMALA
jgi:hypothetical protein